MEVFSKFEDDYARLRAALSLESWEVLNHTLAILACLPTFPQEGFSPLQTVSSALATARYYYASSYCTDWSKPIFCPPTLLPLQRLALSNKWTGLSLPSTPTYTARTNKRFEFTYNRVPYVVLVCVLERLGWDKATSASFRLVCKDWRSHHDAFLPSLQFEYLPHSVQNGWTISQIFPNISELYFDRCRSCPRSCTQPNCFNNSALNALEGLSQLRCLGLNGEMLKFSFNNLTVLAGLTSLSWLRIHNFYLTIPLSKTLSKLPNLRSLSFTWHKTPDKAFQNLSRLTSLTFLELNHGNISTIGSQALSTLVGLRHLDLLGCDQVTDACLSNLCALTDLTFLNLTLCTKVTDVGIQELCKLPKLTFLGLAECRLVTDDGIIALSSISSLTSLRFNCHQNVTRMGLDALSGLQSLKTLRVRDCEHISSEDFAFLRRLSKLESLHLDDCRRIIDADVKELCHAKSLTDIDLDNCSLVTDYGVAHISKLKGLTSLKLFNCRNVTDVGVQSLAKLTGLRKLHLPFCQEITDTGLGYLSKCTSLVSLKFCFCPQVSDHGLRTLTSLLKLEDLNASWCEGITVDGIDFLTGHLTGLTTIKAEHCIYHGTDLMASNFT